MATNGKKVYVVFNPDYVDDAIVAVFDAATVDLKKLEKKVDKLGMGHLVREEIVYEKLSDFEFDD